MTVPDRLDAVEPFLKDVFEAGRYTIMPESLYDRISSVAARLMLAVSFSGAAVPMRRGENAVCSPDAQVCLPVEAGWTQGRLCVGLERRQQRERERES